MFIFPFFHYYGFQYQGFNSGIIKAAYLLLLLFMVFKIGNLFYYTGGKVYYFNLMRLILVSTIISMLMAFLFWGQDFFSSYKSTAPLLGVLYYFFLVKIKPTKVLVERLIVLYTIFFALAWVYGFFKSPEVVFGDPEAQVDDTRGMLRLRIPGIEAVVFFFFLFLNKFNVTRKTYMLILAGLALILIFMQLTRQVLFWSSLIGVLYFLRNYKKLWGPLLLLMILFLASPIKINLGDDSILGSLVNLTEQQVEKQSKGESDVRLKAYNFFFTKFSKNVFTDLLGNGAPYPKSEYGNYYTKYANAQNSLYLSDVGYGHIFVIYGLFGLIVYCILFYRILFSPIPEYLLYVKLFFFYIVLVNIASVPYTNMAFFSIAVYLLSRYQNKYKSEVFNRNKSTLKIIDA